MKYQKVVKNFVTIEAFPCIKCGGESLDFYEDVKYSRAFVTCKNCGFKVSGNMVPLYLWENVDSVESIWNPANNPELVIKKIRDDIRTAIAEIRRIRLMQKENKK